MIRPAFRSLSARIITWCLCVVIFVGTGISAGRYFSAKNDAEEALLKRCESLADSAAAVCVEPLSRSDTQALASYARIFCKRNEELVGFQLKNRDGVVLIDHGTLGSRSDLDYLQLTTTVSAEEASDPVLGVLDLTFSLDAPRGQLSKILIYDVALYAVLFLILCLVVSYLIRRGIVEPLRRLGENVGRNGGEDQLDVPIQLPAEVELQPLAAALESMRLELRAMIDLKSQDAIEMTREAHTRREAEESARAALEEAESASQLKDTFLANTSHELRSPLTAILGYSRVLGRSTSLSGIQQKHLAAIERNADHLNRLIEDLLDLSKIQAGVLSARNEHFQLPDLLSEVAEAARQRTQTHFIEVQISRGSFSNWPWIISDRYRIAQIVRNLVNNAIDHTWGGEIIIDARLEQSVTRDEATLCINVDDSGPGIPEEAISTIFEPFLQLEGETDSSGPGAGLGLAICRRVAGVLNGHLSVANLIPHGARFSFHGTFAIERNRMATVTDVLTTQLPISGRLSSRVLLVDDTEDIRDLTQFHLEVDGGFQVSVASDGEEAITMCARALAQNRIFDCIVLDVRMPGLNGYETVRELRSLGCDVPIIALTAHAMEGERERCLEAGFTDYLSKPVEFPVLIQRVVSLSSKSRT